MVYGAIADLEACGLSAPEKALLRFVRKLNDDNANVNADDAAALRAIGWTDEAIHDAITVCGLFNFYNRWIDGSGVHAMPEEAHRAAGKRMARGGYARGE